MIRLKGPEERKAQKFLEKAAEVGNDKSRCLKSKRGAIIVYKGIDIIAEGYNAPPRDEEECTHCMRDYFRNRTSTTEPCRAIHAEQMAMINALRKNINLEGTAMYYAKNKNGIFVPSSSPSCTICSKLIHELGINFIMMTKEGILKYEPEEFNRLSFEYAWKQLNKKE